MKKQSKSQQQTKKTSHKPDYGDKPWQTPEYGQPNSSKGSQEETCGCGDEEGEKKEK